MIPAVPEHRDPEQPATLPGPALGGETWPEEIAGPIRAGMRARAAAELCEARGLAALLFDRKGAILHVCSPAAGLLGGGLDVVAAHLVGTSGAVNQRLADLINDALAAQTPGSDRPVDRAILPGLATTVTCVPYVDGSPFQMLKGLLILGDESPDLGNRIASLASALQA